MNRLAPFLALVAAALLAHACTVPAPRCPQCRVDHDAEDGPWVERWPCMPAPWLSGGSDTGDVTQVVYPEDGNVLVYRASGMAADSAWVWSSSE